MTRARVLSFMTAMAAAVAVLAMPAMASADTAGGPTAIGQDSNGVSYVGYAAGGSVSLYDANGNPLSNWGAAGTGLGQLGGIVAISVDPSNHVWVLDSNLHVQEFTSAGGYVTGWTLPGCAAGTSVDPVNYGGLVVTANSVFVGHPCADTLLRYSTSGTLQQSLTLPGRPRGVADGPAGSNANQVFVALPDQGEVLTYDGATFSTNASEPPLTLPGTGASSWTPTGVAVKNDSGGDELIVADAQNDYFYLFDPGHLYGPGGTYSQYRTLGHGTGSSAGSYSHITALALHSADGTSLDTNLFIADYNNQRIQRTNDSGYTWWTAAADGPAGTGTGSGPGAVPGNTAAPQVTGNTVVGSTLTCTPGTWTGSPTFTYQWTRNGVAFSDTTTTYTAVASDVGDTISCSVVGTNSAGSSSAVAASDEITITAAASNAVVGVTVDNSALYTDSTSVTIDVVAPAGTTAVTIANDGSFSGAKTFSVTSNGQYPWTLQSAGNERLPKTVYVRFTASGVTPYMTLTDDIILDTTAPAVQTAAITRQVSFVRVADDARLAFVGLSTTRQAKKTTTVKRVSWVLKVKATDAVSGLGKLQYGATRVGKLTTVTYAKSIKVPSLKAAHWIRVIDRAGNKGRWRVTTQTK